MIQWKKILIVIPFAIGIFGDSASAHQHHSEHWGTIIVDSNLDVCVFRNYHDPYQILKDMKALNVCQNPHPDFFNNTQLYEYDHKGLRGYIAMAFPRGKDEPKALGIGFGPDQSTAGDRARAACNPYVKHVFGCFASFFVHTNTWPGLGMSISNPYGETYGPYYGAGHRVPPRNPGF